MIQDVEIASEGGTKAEAQLGIGLEHGLGIYRFPPGSLEALQGEQKSGAWLGSRMVLSID